MDAGDTTPFDDPKFKAALKRALGGETAPELLRARIAGLCRASAPSEEPRGPRLAAPAPAGGLQFKPARLPVGRRSFAWAAGALVLVGAAAISFQVLHPFARTVPPRRNGSGSLPRELAEGLVATHDYCCAGPPDHHRVSAPRDNFPAIGQALGRRLNQAVLAADLRKDGWTFRGAGVCPVGPHPSAHLIFQRPDPGGTQQLSVFSVPAALWTGDSAGAALVYEGQVKEHSLAGVRTGGALFCIVGSSPDGALKPADLSALLDEHLSEATPLAAGNKPRAVLAELLHDRP